MLAMKAVFELPPREFLSKKVSFESLYHMWLFLSFLLWSERELIQDPRTDNDLLI